MPDHKNAAYLAVLPDVPQNFFYHTKKYPGGYYRPDGEGPHGHHAGNTHRGFQESDRGQCGKVGGLHGPFHAGTTLQHRCAPMQYSSDLPAGLADGAGRTGDNSAGHPLFCHHDAGIWAPHGELHAICQRDEQYSGGVCQRHSGHQGVQPVCSFLWKVCRFCPLFPRFHHGMVEPVLALERGGPGGPPFYASGDPSSGSVALHGGKSFSPCLSGGLGGASGVYCASDEGIRSHGAGQHDQGQSGTGHSFFENTGTCPPHKARRAWGAALSI